MRGYYGAPAFVGADAHPAAVTLQVAAPKRHWLSLALPIAGAAALAYAFVPGVRKLTRKVAKKF